MKESGIGKWPLKFIAPLAQTLFNLIHIPFANLTHLPTNTTKSGTSRPSANFIYHGPPPPTAPNKPS